MLATSTYCSGNHGDHSHPTLDLGKSYSRFTPLFLAWHKSFPPPPILRCVREGGKTVKGDTTSKQMKLQTKRTCKTDICISFSHKKILFRQERMVSNVLTKKKYKGDFNSEQQNNVDHVVEKIFSLTLLLWKTGSLDWITCATAQGMDQ